MIIQSVPGGKVSIIEGHSIGHSMQTCICTCVQYTVRSTDEQHAMSSTRVANCIDVDAGIFENVLY
jgi:hypothetical protein